MAKPLTFVVAGAVRNGADFETLASQCEGLKRLGEVEIVVTSLAERTLADIPPGGSPWHDYTSCLPVLEKFVPHKDMVKFLDKEHIARNLRLLRVSAAVLRRHKMGAAVIIHAPWYLPEGYFAKFPHRRGPRIDHPRRTRAEAYSACIDLPENLDIFAEMFGQLIKEVPEVGSVEIMTNDAGGGICWADWLYSGVNGPDHCKNRDVAARVGGLVNAFRKGAGRQDIEFDFSGNFSAAEHRALQHCHDENLQTRSQSGIRAGYNHLSIRNNPVLGLFDPVDLIQALGRMEQTPIHKVVIDFRCNYERGIELPETRAKVLEVVQAFYAQPVFGVRNRMQFLRRLCAKWVGENQADQLLEALYDLNAAWRFRADVLPFFTTNYAGVSMRYINRPLVAIPQRLSPEEEHYWLRHVFNPSLHEARMDYIDFHGGRLTAAPEDQDQGAHTGVLPAGEICRRLNAIADRLEGLKGTGAAAFQRLGRGARICGSIFRSAGNFYAVQKVRDRNLDKFAGAPIAPPKVASWTGDMDLQYLIEFMRDELDNTTHLLGILENGGMSQMLTAKNPADEDTFLLGPDLVNQLKQKMAIMRAHWLDAEQYLASPHK